MIFSRRRGSAGKHARAEERRGSGPRHAAGRGRPEPEAVDEFDGDEMIGPGAGPYDVAEAPEGVPRLDLGSLKIPAIDGVEVRVKASPEGVIQEVVLVSGDSSLQLGALAAPRSEGIWDEVREDIRQSFVAEGATVQEVPGEHGAEVLTRVRTPDGPRQLRIVGIDGPRWMVQAVYQGAAATDPATAGPLADVVAGLVVDRGQEPKPVRDPLPLRLPSEMVQSQEPEAEESAAPANGSAQGRVPGSGRPKPSGRPRRG